MSCWTHYWCNRGFHNNNPLIESTSVVLALADSAVSDGFGIASFLPAG